MSILDELLDDLGVLLGDGAMGTELFERGLESGAPPELWNVEEQARVADVHAAYVEAGSDVILTNSFGANRYRLALHSLADRVVELNEAAAKNARHAVDSAERRVLVAGSMGPTGELVAPLGAMSVDEAADAFEEQARGLVAGGADLLWIETMSDLAEVEAAIAGVRRVGDVPVCATLSFDTAGMTMMGVSGAEAAGRLIPAGVAALGANCGSNLPHTEAAVAELVAHSGGVPVISKANAGIPEWSDGALRYDGSPAVMAAHAVRVRELGATIVGGCCGSSSSHIAKMRAVLDGVEPVPEVARPSFANDDQVDAARGESADPDVGAAPDPIRLRLVLD